MARPVAARRVVDKHVLPLVLVALLQPVSWLDRQRKVQTCTERIGEEISQYGLLMDTDPEEESGTATFPQ